MAVFPLGGEGLSWGGRGSKQSWPLLGLGRRIYLHSLVSRFEQTQPFGAQKQKRPLRALLLLRFRENLLRRFVLGLEAVLLYF